MKYIEILQQNLLLSETVASNEVYNIKILSNITASSLKEILQYFLRIENINAQVHFGEYDNILQESMINESSNSVIVFWELINIVDGFEYKAEIMDDEQLNNLLSNLEEQISLIFKNISNIPIVLFSRFSAQHHSCFSLSETVLERAAKRLNLYVEKIKPKNVVIIDIEKIFSRLSVDKCIDTRNYYSSKSLYTNDFFQAFSLFIKPVFMAILGKSKKALILDCDNTLWGGIIGEDGLAGIELSEKNKAGIPFQSLHYFVKSLAKRGIITGLCSKNNLWEVDEVLSNHPDTPLKNEDFLIKKVNWNDKATNLSEIASELNIGYDSLVFIDDSDFELNLIKERLPEVFTIKVPSPVYLYTKTIAEHADLFYNLSETKEDKARIDMYKTEMNRREANTSFSNLDDYLGSLQLKVIIFIDSHQQVARLAQLSQKTNQFNLTTTRYTENEIFYFINSDKFQVVSFEVLDKFGSYGITGLIILKDVNSETVAVDTFLMSCRVLGRNIEKAVWNEILKLLKNRMITILHADYIATKKNQQTENLFETLGFEVISRFDKYKNYQLIISDHKNFPVNYITIEYGK